MLGNLRKALQTQNIEDFIRTLQSVFGSIPHRKHGKVKAAAAQPSPAQIAIEQIRAKQYDLPFRNRGKTIVLMGIAFDQTQRNINEWRVEQV